MDIKILGVVDMRLEKARWRAHSTDSLVKKLFAVAKSDADVEMQVLREQTEQQIKKVEESVNVLHESLVDDLTELKEQANTFCADIKSYLEEELAEIEGAVGQVGSLCVVLLDRDIKKILCSLLSRVGGVEAGDKFYQLTSQFQDEFGINFEDAPIPWEHVVELHEARNCILHNDSVADGKFRKNVKNPILLDGNRIDCGRKNFDHCTRVFSEFTSYVIKSVAEAKGLEKS